MVSDAPSGRRTRSVTGKQFQRLPQEDYFVYPANPEFLSLEDTSFAKRMSVRKFHRFFDLPLDVRLQIYAYFAETPTREEYRLPEAKPPRGASSEEFQKWETDRYESQEQEEIFLEEGDQIAETRRSLLVASRQVSVEFSPIFYRSIDVVIHKHCNTPNPWYISSPNTISRPTKTSEKPTNADIKTIVTSSTASDFERDFLHNLASWKISQIRFLDYNVSITGTYALEKFWIRLPDKFQFESGRQDTRLHTSSNIDFESLMQLSHTLKQYKGSLVSLEELCLRGEGDERLTGLYALPKSLITDKAEPQEVWEAMPEHRKWEAVEHRMVGARDQAAQSTAPLSGWEVTRILDLEGSIIRDRVDIKEVSLVFRKPKGNISKKHIGAEGDGGVSPSSQSTKLPWIDIFYAPSFWER
ncbi:hypothetical protein H2200_008820 [Cladophialophora chaetospira]|uniref:Uncharacterized protein n=1 Tax=Cladophialophora chaetospira TaxID=386627 RepID=A0AA38X4U8_9EURO|nr:hypothetical protein H2200_008820 [Cladophialophora chaetospira]